MRRAGNPSPRGDDVSMNSSRVLMAGAVRRVGVGATLILLTVAVEIPIAWPNDAEILDAISISAPTGRRRADVILDATRYLEGRVLANNGVHPDRLQTEGLDPVRAMEARDLVPLAASLQGFDQDLVRVASGIAGSWVHQPGIDGRTEETYGLPSEVHPIALLLNYAVVAPDQSARWTGRAWRLMSDPDLRIRNLAKTCVGVHASQAEARGHEPTRAHVTGRAHVTDGIDERWRQNGAWWRGVACARVLTQVLSLRTDEAEEIRFQGYLGRDVRTLWDGARGELVTVCEPPLEREGCGWEPSAAIASVTSRRGDLVGLQNVAHSYGMGDEVLSLIRARWIDGPTVYIDSTNVDLLIRCLGLRRLVEWLVDCEQRHRPVTIDWKRVFAGARRGSYEDAWWVWSCVLRGASACADVATRIEAFNPRTLEGAWGCRELAIVAEDLRERMPVVPQFAFDRIEALDELPLEEIANTSLLLAGVRIVSAVQGERAVRRVPWSAAIAALERNRDNYFVTPAFIRVSAVSASELSTFVRRAREIIRPWDICARLELALRAMNFDEPQ